MVFLSTLSLRRATQCKQSRKLLTLFLSTLSLRRATAADISTRRDANISIHALLAESDSVSSVINDVIDHFYPRSPCGERHSWGGFSECIYAFLSTLSLRRATREPTAFRTPHHIFLSTLSLRRATAPEGADIGHKMNFYPRSPCGERPPRCKGPWACFRFLSTLSLRRATNTAICVLGKARISIHALLAESDCRNGKAHVRNSLFLSTLSLRRATSRYLNKDLAQSISIHALLAESDKRKSDQSLQ